MTTTEFYYLLLVIGAFGAFSAGTILSTIQYKAWLRRESGRRAEALMVSETRAPARTLTARAA